MIRNRGLTAGMWPHFMSLCLLPVIHERHFIRGQ